MSSSSHIISRAGDSDFTANDPQQSPRRNSCMNPASAYAKQSASRTNAKATRNLMTRKPCATDRRTPTPPNAKHLRHRAARDTQLVRHDTQRYSFDRAATWQKHTPQWRLRPLRPISGPSNNKGTSAPPHHGSTRSQQPPRRQRHKHLCTSPSQLHPKQIQVVTVATRRASAASHSRGHIHLAPLHRLQARRKPTDIKQASTRRYAPMPAAASTKPVPPRTAAPEPNHKQAQIWSAHDPGPKRPPTRPPPPRRLATWPSPPLPRGPRAATAASQIRAKKLAAPPETEHECSSRR